MQRINGTLWAIHAPVLANLCDIGASTAGLDFRGLPAVHVNRMYYAGTVAVIALRGILEHRNERDGPEPLGGIGTSLRAFLYRLHQALADPAVTGIVLDVDSPGGPLEGIQETADELHDARGRKPIVAVANSKMAGTAYWLASQASEVSITLSGEAGGIGVAVIHVDESERLAQEGRRMSLVAAGKHKVDGNPYQPLSSSARDHMQRQVDREHAAFVSAVARGRALPSARVLAGFGQGRTLGARAAVAAGMIDRVETLEAAIQRLQGRPGGPASTRARRYPTNPAAFEFWRVSPKDHASNFVV